jgi:hypothetical protein
LKDRYSKYPKKEANEKAITLIQTVWLQAVMTSIGDHKKKVRKEDNFLI